MIHQVLVQQKISGIAPEVPHYIEQNGKYVPAGFIPPITMGGDITSYIFYVSSEIVNYYFLGDGDSVKIPRYLRVLFTSTDIPIPK